MSLLSAKKKCFILVGEYNCPKDKLRIGGVLAIFDNANTAEKVMTAMFTSLPEGNPDNVNYHIFSNFIYERDV